MTPLRQYLFEFVTHSVMTRTLEGRINFWNRRAEELYGWRKEEAIGKVSHSLLQTQFPKPLEQIESELARAGRWEGKLVHTTRDGSRVAVKSRWTLDPTLQPGEVVEINARSSDSETDPNARTDTYSAQIGRQEPAPASKMKADDLLLKTANIVLAGGAFLCILVLFYFLYYYGWTAERHFSSPFRMVLYWVFPAVLASLLFGCLRWSSELKINVAVLCLSTAISIYGAELFLTFSSSAIFPPGALTGPGNMRSQRENDAIVKLAKRFGVEFDSRTKLEVINVFPRKLFGEQNDVPLESAIRINGTEVLPLAGISNKVTVLCNENGAYVTYTSDEHGFHNPPGIWSLDHIDVAAVGDSFAHGACVPSDGNFVSLIRKHYPATLNLGGAGHGPLFVLASLKEYLPRVTPKVVLWFYFEGNDLGELRREMESPLLMAYTKGDFNQDLLDRQSDIDKALTRYIQEEERLEIKSQETARQKDKTMTFDTVENFIKLGAVRRKLGLVDGGPILDEDAETTAGVRELDMFRDILLEAKASVESWNGQLYFVYLPEWDRYARPQLARKDRESVLRLVESLNIPAIDLHPAFQAQADPLSLFPFRRFGHYNEEGHRLVAETVRQSLSSKAVSPNPTPGRS
jgi:PAS domain S-box-containing protein